MDAANGDSMQESIDYDSPSQETRSLLDSIRSLNCSMMDGGSAEISPTREISFRHGSAVNQVKMGPPIGRGSYGTVYQGLKCDDGMLLAVKQFNVSNKPNILEEVAREFEMYQRMQHPNIVKQLGFYCNLQIAQIFMEYVPGGSVASVLRRFGYLHEMTIAKYIEQLLEGLRFLHEHSVIHRDIKPHNMLLGVNGVIKLSDFGTCLRIAELTECPSNRFCGTIPYASREALIGHACVQSDIWSVGCTLCEMATGSVPWSHLENITAPEQLVGYIIHHPDETPQIPDHLLQSCKDFIAATFHPDAQQRPSAEDLLQHPFLCASSSFPVEHAQTVDKWVKQVLTTGETGPACATTGGFTWYEETSNTETSSTGETEMTQEWKAVASQGLTSKEVDLINSSRVLYRRIIDASTLAHQYPPIFYFNNKKVAYDIATGATGTLDGDGKYSGDGWKSLRGTVEFIRWNAFLLPTKTPPHDPKTGTHYIMKEGIMSYDPIPASELPPRLADRKIEVWHMNFADRCLFQHYSTQNLRQDALQVLTHPVLSSVAEMLDGSPHRYTVPLAPEAEAKCQYVQPTPILLRNVERRVNLKVDKNAAEGRPDGLLGDGLFVEVPEEVVVKALEVIDPPTMTNLIAVAAPWAVSQRSKRYTPGHILSAFIAIYTAYRAAVLSTWQATASTSDSPAEYDALQPQADPEKPVVMIHTGNWGTGAYGGNRVLMALLQLIAAHMAEVDVLVFHTYKAANSADYTFAMTNFHWLFQYANGDTSRMLEFIYFKGFNWQ